MSKAIFDIVLEPDSIQVSQGDFSRQVFARIYCVTGDACFPEQGWDDFALIVLEWWSQQWFNLAEGRAAEFQFMDGAFHFTSLPAAKPGEVAVSFYENRQLVKTMEIRQRLLMEKLSKTFNQLLRLLAEAGETGSDEYQRLAENFMRAQQFAARHKVGQPA